MEACNSMFRNSCILSVIYNSTKYPSESKALCNTLQYAPLQRWAVDSF